MAIRDILVALTLLAFLKGILEEARQAKLWVRTTHAIIYCLIIVWAHVIAQNWSLPRIEASINSPDALRDISLLVMLDFSISIYTATTLPIKKKTLALYDSIRKSEPLGTTLPKSYTNIPQRKTKVLGYYATLFMHILPTILILPALFFFRFLMFYWLPGSSFIAITISLCLIVSGFALAAPYIVIPFVGTNRETKNKAAVMISFIAIIVIVAAGVMHPSSRIYIQQISQANWIDLITTILTILAGCLIGLFTYKLRENIKTKRQNKIH